MQNRSSPEKPRENPCAEMMLQLSTVKKACSSNISSKSGTLLSYDNVNRFTGHEEVWRSFLCQWAVKHFWTICGLKYSIKHWICSDVVTVWFSNIYRASVRPTALSFQQVLKEITACQTRTPSPSYCYPDCFCLCTWKKPTEEAPLEWRAGLLARARQIKMWRGGFVHQTCSFSCGVCDRIRPILMLTQVMNVHERQKDMDPAHMGAFSMRIAWLCALWWDVTAVTCVFLFFLQSFVETDVAQLHLVFYWSRWDSCITCGKHLEENLDDFRHFLLGEMVSLLLNSQIKRWYCVIGRSGLVLSPSTMRGVSFWMCSEVTRGERTGHWWDLCGDTKQNTNVQTCQSLAPETQYYRKNIDNVVY